MSVTLPPRWLSTSAKVWVITVLVIIVITWHVAADIVSVSADALTLVTGLCVWLSVQQRSTATIPTGINSR